MGYNRNFIILILAGATVSIPIALAADTKEYKEKKPDTTTTSKIDEVGTDQSSGDFFTSNNSEAIDTGWKIPNRIKNYLVNDQSHGDQRNSTVAVAFSSSESAVTNRLPRVRAVNFTNLGTVPLNNNFALFGKVALSVEETDDSSRNAVFGGISESEKNGTEMTFVVGAKYNF